MADPKGFLKHTRELPAKRPVEVRKQDWKELYEPMAAEKTTQNIPIKANRGNIYAQDGSLLATSVSRYDVRFDPVTVSVSNFEKLMPENIAKFEVIDENCFEFGLKGMPEIKLVMKEKVEPTKIVLGAASSKLPFTLTANIESVSDNSSDVQLQFEGDFNPMMAMMIKGPITKFIETLTTNLQSL